MLIVGYCYGIRSERRLCEKAHLNLAYRWFCRLSLEDEIPNHSSFSKNRHGRFRLDQRVKHFAIHTAQPSSRSTSITAAMSSRGMVCPVPLKVWVR